jgi:hypothetical protein
MQHTMPNLHCYTCTVGKKPSEAQAYLNDIDEVSTSYTTLLYFCYRTMHYASCTLQLYHGTDVPHSCCIGISSLLTLITHNHRQLQYYKLELNNELQLHDACINSVDSRLNNIRTSTETAHFNAHYTTSSQVHELLQGLAKVSSAVTRNYSTSALPDMQRQRTALQAQLDAQQAAHNSHHQHHQQHRATAQQQQQQSQQQQLHDLSMLSAQFHAAGSGVSYLCVTLYFNLLNFDYIHY